MGTRSGGGGGRGATADWTSALRVLVAAWLVLFAGCSAGSTGDAASTPTTELTPAPVPSSTPHWTSTTTTTATPTTTDPWADGDADADGWSARVDPNPALDDPGTYRDAYAALVATDHGIADAFNALVVADGAHRAPERAVYRVLPALSPALRTVVVEHLVATGRVRDVDAGTANVLRYMAGSPHHDVTPDLRRSLATTEWTDADGDRLVDPIEVVAGTDPSTPHSDSDQWTDFEELLVLEAVGLPDAHPTEDDVYVEVDSTTDARLHEFQREALADEAFANADRPVHWHFLETGRDTDLATVRSWDEFFPDQQAETFDHYGTGVHYLFVTDAPDGVTDDGEPGRTYPGLIIVSNAAVETRAETEAGRRLALAHLVVHVFGHTFGLTTGDYRGIDTTGVGYDEYPGPMAREPLGPSRDGARPSTPDGLRFSDGDPFDDVAEIRNQRYGAETGLGDGFLDKVTVEQRANLVWDYPEHALAEVETG